jgi:hypothetical protein
MCPLLAMSWNFVFSRESKTLIAKCKIPLLRHTDIGCETSDTAAAMAERGLSLTDCLTGFVCHEKEPPRLFRRGPTDDLT